MVSDDLGQRIGGSRALLHHRLIEPLGRCGSATLCMVCGGVGVIARGYLYDVWLVAAVRPVHRADVLRQPNFSVVGPYMAEI